MRAMRLRHLLCIACAESYSTLLEPRVSASGCSCLEDEPSSSEPTALSLRDPPAFSLRKPLFKSGQAAHLDSVRELVPTEHGEAVSLLFFSEASFAMAGSVAFHLLTAMAALGADELQPAVCDAQLAERELLAPLHLCAAVRDDRFELESEAEP
mmetsp:Transcript_18245/g.38614  ORF Transcript_18245/g.38614 Transcript_18245/m.38614 type:complete len:154 (-) Transcript_18245:377-838(-)